LLPLIYGFGTGVLDVQFDAATTQTVFTQTVPVPAEKTFAHILVVLDFVVSGGGGILHNVQASIAVNNALMHVGNDQTASGRFQLVNAGIFPTPAPSFDLVVYVNNPSPGQAIQLTNLESATKIIVQFF
jgi:hypothetical protein